MKRPPLILLIILLCLPLSSKAQNYLEMPVSIHANHENIVHVLGNLEEQLEFNFSYEALLINEKRNISIDEQNKPLRKVLKKILDDDLEYKVVGTHVIIQSSLDPLDKKANSFSFKGQVMGPDHQPLENAVVYEANRQKVAITSYDGYYFFSLKDDEHPIALNISSEGMSDTLVYLSKGQIQGGVNIPLRRKRGFSEGLAPIEGPLEPQLIPIETKSLSDIRMVKLLVPDDALYVSRNLNAFTWQTAQISLLPYVGTNSLTKGLATNNVSINVLAGYTAEIKGAEVGALANIVQNNVTGFQAAGLANFVGNDVTGVQVSGLSNITLGNVKGLQASGIFNMVKGHHSGFMISGIMNITQGGNNKERVKGIKAQVSGIANIHNNDTAHIQITSLYNQADYVEGLQISAILNISSKGSKGVQISALYNQTKTLDGLQIGLVNVADTVRKGIPIGLINIIGNGYKKFELSTNETFFINASYKTGGNHFYSFLTGGYGKFINAGYGLGVTTNHKKKFSVNFDVIGSGILSADSDYQVFNGALGKVQLGFNYQFAPHFTISMGPSFNFFKVYTEEDVKVPSEIASGSTIYYGSHHIDQAIVNQADASWFGWHFSLRF